MTWVLVSHSNLEQTQRTSFSFQKRTCWTALLKLRYTLELPKMTEAMMENAK